MYCPDLIKLDNIHVSNSVLTCPFFEQPLEMKWAEVYMLCDGLKVRLTLEIVFDVVNRLGDALIVDI